MGVEAVLAETDAAAELLPDLRHHPRERRGVDVEAVAPEHGGVDLAQARQPDEGVRDVEGNRRDAHLKPPSRPLLAGFGALGRGGRRRAAWRDPTPPSRSLCYAPGVLRAALACAALSAWLVLLFAGWTLGGAVYLLLVAALVLFPWRAGAGTARDGAE